MAQAQSFIPGVPVFEECIGPSPLYIAKAPSSPPQPLTGAAPVYEGRGPEGVLPPRGPVKGDVSATLQTLVVSAAVVDQTARIAAREETSEQIAR